MCALAPFSLPVALIDHAWRWRPVVPEFVINQALRRDRGGIVPAEPDAPRKKISYSQRSIDRTRVQMLRTQAFMDPPPRSMKRSDVLLPNCTAQRLTLPSSRPGHVLLYFHGGAFLRGSTETHAGALARFMKASRCEAMSVDYRMAPEHHFPTWIDDAVDAYRHLLEYGTDPAKIAVGGDSAGGSLALALIQSIALEGLPQPAAAFVVSPWADLTSTGPSHTTNVESEVMFGPGVIENTANWLATQADVPATDPLFSPAFGNYPSDAPPLRIDVSAREVLRSDSDLVAGAYAAHGAVVDLHEHPSAPHAWTAIGVLRAARETCREIGTFIDEHLAE